VCPGLDCRLGCTPALSLTYGAAGIAICGLWSYVSVIPTGGLGRLATWPLPGGPVSPLARWAATSNVERGSGTEEGPRGPYYREMGFYLDKLFAGAPEFLVAPLLMGPVCLISRGRFEKPVRPWLCFSTFTFKWRTVKNLGAVERDALRRERWLFCCGSKPSAPTNASWHWHHPDRANWADVPPTTPSPRDSAPTPPADPAANTSARSVLHCVQCNDAQKNYDKL